MFRTFWYDRAARGAAGRRDARAVHLRRHLDELLLAVHRARPSRIPRCRWRCQLLQANYFVDYSIVLAGVLLATMPLILLFVFAGRQLVSGIMQGAVKG